VFLRREPATAGEGSFFLSRPLPVPKWEPRPATPHAVYRYGTCPPNYPRQMLIFPRATYHKSSTAILYALSARPLCAPLGSSQIAPKISQLDVDRSSHRNPPGPGRIRRRQSDFLKQSQCRQPSLGSASNRTHRSSGNHEDWTKKSRGSCRRKPQSG
jgi:hypothetical protein